MKIHPVGAELFHAEKDRHDEANSHFFNSADVPKNRDVVAGIWHTQGASKLDIKFS
jgi:hypothetical protein